VIIYLRAALQTALQVGIAAGFAWATYRLSGDESFSTYLSYLLIMTVFVNIESEIRQREERAR